jgi:hypothetical protein
MKHASLQRVSDSSLPLRFNSSESSLVIMLPRL